MYYDGIGSIINSILFLWIVFLVFQRINNRYPASNPWKKDLILTFIQSVVVVLVALPIMYFFIK
ncbi:hypothetical protein [Sutcliffiella sp. NC1]|uniref:Uncharacterized protein n=1 Tax=Sutcliffiella cohnii TaxID=33932 RepID=A0A223KNY1_9BACI|nr:hypothetical protein [Sutcliffiella sp. NC1]AST91210.1 hypothetical protein BC6307_07920 [Sutcliffiella cohnii]WBL17025.1 hypothetical protein O1A01_10495 [Sutcliffiella sp. NC1]